MSTGVIELPRLVIEHTADAVIYADRDGTIRIWNAAAEALFGFPRAAAIGQNLDLIIPERLRASHWEGFHRAVASGRTRLGGRPMITRSVNAAGATIDVAMRFSDDDRAVLGSVAVARDATQRREDERTLQARLRALEAASRPPAPAPE
jgi:PAS domain S-box-containing protein